MIDAKEALSFSRRGNALIGQEMFNLLDYAKGLEREGRRIYHLELGDPKNYRGTKNYPPGRVINSTIKSLLDSNVGYTSPFGMPVLRQKLADHFSKTTARKISSENIAISPANMLIFQALDIICEPGDRVALFTPTFPTYRESSNYVGAAICKIPLPVENGFQLTEESIDKAFFHKPKLIFINSGNNPTGAVYSKSTLDFLVSKAMENNCWIISDETYGRLCYENEFYSLSHFDYEKLILISSFSKIFNIPGYRIGYALADSRVINKIGLSSSTLYSCLPIFTQDGVADGMTIVDEFAEDRRRYYKDLCNDCMSILKKTSLLRCVKPESAFYLFIDITKLNVDDKVFCSRLLKECNTVVTPGSCFDCNGFIRASFCGNTEDVTAGLQRLVEFAEFIHP